MYRALFAIVFFCAQHAMAASASFWVSVGSFQDPVVAERVVGEASTALNETFSVQRSETANGIVQRVATGPFDSRDEAQTALDHAKVRGYPDSWIFSRQADAMTVTQAGDPDESNLARFNGDSADAMQNNSIQQPYVAEQPQPTLQELLKQVKELPTDIPPGYRLNQLYRDGQIPPSNKQQ
jgi:hypothetical protein